MDTITTIDTITPTEARARPDVLLKIGGAMAVVGGLTELVGNVLHPRSTSYYDDPVAWLHHNVHSDIWFPSHVLILLGAIVAMGGFVALTRALAGSAGHGLGQLALANAVVGTTLMVVTLVIDGLVVPELEGVWTADSGSSPDSVLAGTILYYTIFNFLYVFMITLFGLAPIFYGAALLVTKRSATWFGWLGVAAGSVVTVSAVLSMVDISRKTLDATVWPITATVVVAWFAVIGLSLWRGPGRWPARVVRAA